MEMAMSEPQDTTVAGAGASAGAIGDMAAGLAASQPARDAEGNYTGAVIPPASPPAGATSVSGTDTAADQVAAMAERLANAKLGAVLGDWEARLNATMAAAQKAADDGQAQLRAQIRLLQGQLAATRAQVGPPEAQVLAVSLAKRVKSIADANPDLHPLHMTGVTDQARRLSDAVTAVVNGDTSTNHLAEAELLANGIGTWFTRTHPRAYGKVLEGFHEVLSEAERILELLPDLAPVAKAVAAAL